MAQAVTACAKESPISSAREKKSAGPSGKVAIPGIASAQGWLFSSAGTAS
jgi:hypothetical protein